MDFKSSKTYENLQKNYKEESKTSTKYRIYGKKAKEDGYQQIGQIYDETSANEQEHAEIWFELIHESKEPTTYDNLVDAYQGEYYEWTQMYQEYADIAMQEGYVEIAQLFHGVARIEQHHDYRFEKLANNIQKGTVFCKDENEIWICMNCGNVYFGKCAPEICPVCGYLQGYYEINCENY